MPAIENADRLVFNPAQLKEDPGLWKRLAISKEEDDLMGSLFLGEQENPFQRGDSAAMDRVQQLAREGKLYLREVGRNSYSKVEQDQEGMFLGDSKQGKLAAPFDPVLATLMRATKRYFHALGLEKLSNWMGKFVDRYDSFKETRDSWKREYEALTPEEKDRIKRQNIQEEKQKIAEELAEKLQKKADKELKKAEKAQKKAEKAQQKAEKAREAAKQALEEKRRMAGGRAQAPARQEPQQEQQAQRQAEGPAAGQQQPVIQGQEPAVQGQEPAVQGQQPEVPGVIPPVPGAPQQGNIPPVPEAPQPVNIPPVPEAPQPVNIPPVPEAPQQGNIPPVQAVNPPEEGVHPERNIQEQNIQEQNIQEHNDNEQPQEEIDHQQPQEELIQDQPQEKIVVEQIIEEPIVEEPIVEEPIVEAPIVQEPVIPPAEGENLQQEGQPLPRQEKDPIEGEAPLNQPPELEAERIHIQPNRQENQEKVPLREQLAREQALLEAAANWGTTLAEALLKDTGEDQMLADFKNNQNERLGRTWLVGTVNGMLGDPQALADPQTRQRILDALTGGPRLDMAGKPALMAGNQRFMQAWETLENQGREGLGDAAPLSKLLSNTIRELSQAASREGELGHRHIMIGRLISESFRVAQESGNVRLDLNEEELAAAKGALGMAQIAEKGMKARQHLGSLERINRDDPQTEEAIRDLLTMVGVEYNIKKNREDIVQQGNAPQGEQPLQSRYNATQILIGSEVLSPDRLSQMTNTSKIKQNMVEDQLKEILEEPRGAMALKAGHRLTNHYLHQAIDMENARLNPQRELGLEEEQIRNQEVPQNFP